MGFEREEEYKEEREICRLLNLRVDKFDQVQAYFGWGPPDGGKTPSGWQMVCHLSKVKMYLANLVHTEHRKKFFK